MWCIDLSKRGWDGRKISFAACFGQLDVADRESLAEWLCFVGLGEGREGIVGYVTRASDGLMDMFASI